MYRPSLNTYFKPAAVVSYTSSTVRTNESKESEKKKDEVLKSTITKDYLNNTSLHGLNFVGSTNITMFER